MLKRIIQTKTDVSSLLYSSKQAGPRYFVAPWYNSERLRFVRGVPEPTWSVLQLVHIINVLFINNYLFQNDADLLAFQEELEEDEEARKNVNIYRDPNKNLDSDCEEDIPRIDLAEMMEMVDLNKNDEEMPDLEG